MAGKTFYEKRKNRFLCKSVGNYMEALEGPKYNPHYDQADSECAKYCTLDSQVQLWFSLCKPGR